MKINTGKNHRRGSIILLKIFNQYDLLSDLEETEGTKTTVRTITSNQ